MTRTQLSSSVQQDHQMHMIHVLYNPQKMDAKIVEFIPCGVQTRYQELFAASMLHHFAYICQHKDIF